MGQFLKVLLKILKRVSKKLYRQLIKVVKSTSKKVIKSLAKRWKSILNIFTKRGLKQLLSRVGKFMKSTFSDFLYSYLGKSLVNIFNPSKARQRSDKYQEESKNRLLNNYKSKLDDYFTSRIDKIRTNREKLLSLKLRYNNELDELHKKYDELSKNIDSSIDYKLESINYKIRKLNNKIFVTNNELELLDTKENKLVDRKTKIISKDKKLTNSESKFNLGSTLLKALPVLVTSLVMKTNNEEVEDSEELDSATKEDYKQVNELESDIDAALKEGKLLPLLLSYDEAIKKKYLGGPTIDTIIDGAIIASSFIPVVGPFISATLFTAKDIVLPLVMLGAFGNALSPEVSEVRKRYPSAYEKYFSKGALFTKYLSDFSNNLKHRLYWVTKVRREIDAENSQIEVITPMSTKVNITTEHTSNNAEVIIKNNIQPISTKVIYSPVVKPMNNFEVIKTKVVDKQYSNINYPDLSNTTKLAKFNLIQSVSEL